MPQKSAVEGAAGGRRYALRDSSLTKSSGSSGLNFLPCAHLTAASESNKNHKEQKSLLLQSFAQTNHRLVFTSVLIQILRQTSIFSDHCKLMLQLTPRFLMALLLSWQFPLFSYAKRAVYFPFAEEKWLHSGGERPRSRSRSITFAAMWTAPPGWITLIPLLWSINRISCIFQDQWKVTEETSEMKLCSYTFISPSRGSGRVWRKGTDSGRRCRAPMQKHDMMCWVRLWKAA